MRILNESPLEQLVGAGLFSGLVLQIVGVISALAGEVPMIVGWMLLGGSILTTGTLIAFLAFYKRNTHQRIPIVSIVPLAGSGMSVVGAALWVGAWWMGYQSIVAISIAFTGPVLVLVGLIMLVRTLKNPT